MQDYESYVEGLEARYEHEAPSTWPIWVPVALWGLLMAGVIFAMLVST